MHYQLTAAMTGLANACITVIACYIHQAPQTMHQVRVLAGTGGFEQGETPCTWLWLLKCWSAKNRENIIRWIHTWGASEDD